VLQELLAIELLIANPTGADRERVLLRGWRTVWASSASAPAATCPSPPPMHRRANQFHGQP
jgi:hypothetical protein